MSKPPTNDVKAQSLVAINVVKIVRFAHFFDLKKN